MTPEITDAELYAALSRRYDREVEARLKAVHWPRQPAPTGGLAVIQVHELHGALLQWAEVLIGTPVNIGGFPSGVALRKDGA
jgi:hypothetical protein